MAEIIGVDIGTTSTKVILYNQAGKIIASENHGYPLYQTVPGMAEESPTAIYDAVVAGITAVAAKATQPVAGLSFSAAMHSLILLDDQFVPLTRMYTWADNRAAAAAAQLRALPNAHELYRHTGTPLHPMTPLSKLVWLAQTQPTLHQQARWFVDIKAYILHRLCGQLVTDYSLANATGLFNLQTFDWDAQALKLAQVQATQLPQLVDTTTQLTGFDPQLAATLHLSPATPLIVGASDGCLANLGVNAIDPGIAAVTIGTSGAVRVVTDTPKLDPEGRLFCYYLAPHRWVVGGPVNNGGNVLHWVQETLFAAETAANATTGQSTYDLITSLAAKVPAGSHGLLMHPYLNGERAPLWDANARGAYFGLTARHTRAEMARAAMEGIIFNLAHVAKMVQALTGPFTNLQATGGFARSTTWRQILADIFDTTVTVPASTEGSSLGAAVLGFESLGLITNLAEVHHLVGNTTSQVPNPTNVQTYQALFPIYEQLAEAYQPIFKELAKFK
ncbi:gluconokinase [Lactiplantibacillus sp. WILCCON 0030]|uniref:Gluconokinase n=1 Tax=Lactiplantibacillus brownii TaxID=3069269 RepID=A0ABU1A8G7_9LACO|nr:gluconokinase [Lactiplantibacillus brownii]MDQ7936930.1 gluconokinase [Lactiplantibacillus brownii]